MPRFFRRIACFFGFHTFPTWDGIVESDEPCTVCGHCIHEKPPRRSNERGMVGTVEVRPQPLFVFALESQGQGG